MAATAGTVVATVANSGLGRSLESMLQPKRGLGRAVTAVMAILMFAMTVGCSRSNVSTQDSTAELTLSGNIVGFPALQGNDGIGSVTVAGSSGFRHQSAPLAPNTAGQVSVPYRVLLQDLSAPYLAQALTGFDPNSGIPLFYYSVSTGAGSTNLTPLTTLLVAQLLSTDPVIYFPNPGASNSPGADVINATTIAAAQARVTRYLENVVGVSVRSGTASFVTTSFNATAGDPMYDTIVALNARLADNGSNIAALSTQIASAAVYCQLERVPVTLGSNASDEICPANKSSLPDEGDATITVYGFTTLTGNSVTVRARESSVLGVEYLASDGSSFLCNGAACSSVTLSAPAANGTRSLTFANTSLTGGAGAASLTGALISAYQGTTYAVPPCLDNKRFIVRPDNSVDADCIPVDFFRTGTRGPTRQVYSFADFNAALLQTLEIVATDQAIYSALVATSDPDTGELGADFACRNSGCSNVTVNAADSNGARRISLNAARIASIDGSGDVLVDGSFFVTTPVTDFTPPDCSASTVNVAVTLSDETAPINVCPPPDGSLQQTFSDGNGGFNYTVQNQFTANGGFQSGESVTVTTSNDVVTRVLFSRRDLERLGCADSACAGVTLGALAEDGSRAINFSNVRLTEQESAGLTGDRTAALSGRFIAPPPPPE